MDSSTQHPENSLEAKIQEWLEKTGYPLEMRVAGHFEAAGFDVRQAATFLDGKEDKGREIDVLASDPDILGILNISFVVECKATDKPWVIFTSDKRDNYSDFVLWSAVKSKDARQASFPTLAMSKHFNALATSTRIGYSLRTAMAGNVDEGYHVTKSLLAACASITREKEADPNALTTWPNLSFAFPVIVVSSKLFECSLDPNGRPALKEVSHTKFKASAFLPQPVECTITVVTEAEAPNYAREAKNIAAGIRYELYSHEQKIAPALRRPSCPYPKMNE